MKKYLRQILVVILSIFLSCSIITVYAEEIVEEEQETIAGTEEITEDQQENDECLLNYIYVDQISIEQDSSEIICASFTNTIEDASIVVENDEDYYVVPLTETTDDLIIFEKEFNETGVYSLETITYTLNNEQTTINLHEIGIDASFEVIEKQEEISVVSLSGNDSSEAVEEIGEALEQAQESVENETTLLSTVTDSLFTDVEAVSNLVICLDPGHGGEDSGAVGVNEVYEKDLTLKIAQYLKEDLEKYSGVTVIMTRDTDVRLGNTEAEDLQARAQFAYNNGADVLISMHLNSYNGKADGAEVYYPNTNYNATASTIGQNLASNIQSQLTSLGLTDRGIKVKTIEGSAAGYDYPDGSYGDYYGIIRRSKNLGIPAIIIEHCFIDNENDYNNYLSSDSKLQTLAAADCAGIVNAYGLSLKQEKEAILEGYTLKLDGSITVNTYMTLPDSILSDNSAYVSFMVPNNGSYTEQKVYVSNASTEVKDGKTYYIFPCSVSAKEMTSSIKIQLKSDSYTGNQHSFTVKYYGDYILGNTSSYSQKDIDIVNALLSYGAYSQTYFDYNTGYLPTSLSTLSDIDLSSYKKMITSTDSNVSFVGARLVLQSTLGLKLYFKGTGNFKVDGSSVSTTTEGNYTVLTINNINPVYLNHMYLIQVGSLSMNYGILSYGYEAMNTSNTSLMNLCKSLYNYYLALNEEEQEEQQSDMYDSNGYRYIMGTGHVTVSQMVSFFNAHNSSYDTFSNYGTTYDGVLAQGGASTIEEFCQIFYEEAKTEGVNVEVAFCQAMLETGWLKFGGDVLPNQYNFAGLGATGGVSGNSFADVRTGIRAQIQHLKAYASTDALVNTCVDPRFTYVTRGCAPTVEDLSKKWASNEAYGNNINNLITQLLIY